MSGIPMLSIAELEQRGEAALQTGPFGTQLKASEYTAEGTPVINVRNIGFGTLRKADLEYVPEGKAAKLWQHHLKRGDIVFGRKGAVERHALIDVDSDGWIQGSDCLRLRISSETVSEKYLSYYLRTAAHQDWMQALCSFGATMSSLNQDILRRLTFPAPPLATQQKIAAILSTYDDLIANNQRRITLLERMAEDIYREWFVRLRFPGHKNVKLEKGVPQGWRVAALGEIFKTASGGTPSRAEPTNFDGEIAWIKTGELKAMFAIGSEEKITQRGIDSSAAKVYKKYTVVMAMYCAMPDLSVIANEAATNQACCAFIPRNANFHHSFSYFLIKFAQLQLVSFAHGAAQQNLSQEIIKKFPVLLPSENLISAFGARASPIFDAIEVLMRSNLQLKSTRDSLLPRLISGKLSVDALDIRFPPGMLEPGA